MNDTDALYEKARESVERYAQAAYEFADSVTKLEKAIKVLKEKHPEKFKSDK